MNDSFQEQRSLRQTSASKATICSSLTMQRRAGAMMRVLAKQTNLLFLSLFNFIVPQVLHSLGSPPPKKRSRKVNTKKGFTYKISKRFTQMLKLTHSSRVRSVSALNFSTVGRIVSYLRDLRFPPFLQQL